MPKTPEDRKRALHFYFRGMTGAQEDWAESGVIPEGVSIDADVVSLADQFAEVRAEAVAGARGVKPTVWSTKQLMRAEHTMDALNKLLKEAGIEHYAVGMVPDEIDQTDGFFVSVRITKDLGERLPVEVPCDIDGVRVVVLYRLSAKAAA